MELGLNLGMGRQPKSAVGAPDPSAGFALYLDFKNSLYRSGSTISTAPPEICGDTTMAGTGWWAFDAGITISGGKLNYGAVSGNAYHLSVLNIGATYTATYTIDSLSGGNVGTQGIGGTNHAVAGTFTETFVATQSYFALGTSGSTPTAVVDNVSVKAQVGNIATMPGYTYTRSGAKSELNGTASPVAFAANTPGIVPAIGYWSRAALTNSILQSQDFATSWTLSAATVTANTTVAPDGTTTADTLTATGAISAATQTLTVAATVQTASLFVAKASTAAFAYIQINDGTGPTNASFITFNMTTGAIGTSTNLVGTLPLTGYAVDCGTFWRFIITFTPTQTTMSTYFAMTDAANTRSVTTGKTLIAWQGQLLAGNFPDGGANHRHDGCDGKHWG